jgi:hypothetical protein
MDDIEKITARARAAADGIIAQAFPDADDEFPEMISIEIVRDLIAAGFGTGKQEGLAEGRVMIEELQGHLQKLLKLLQPGPGSSSFAEEE